MFTQGHSRILAVGAHVPNKSVTSQELMEHIDVRNRFELEPDWLERITGIEARCVSDPGMQPSDLATLAAQDALQAANCAADSIDAIIYAGMTRDNVEPATAHNVQHKLGARRAIAVDVSNACLGFMSAVHLMDALIATGQARRGLIVTGEQGFRYAEHALEELLHTHDKSVLTRLTAGLTLGDAGGAMLLGPKLGPDSGIQEIGVSSDGDYSTLCTIKDDLSPLRADMPPLFSQTAKMAYALYREMMEERLRWRPAQLDYYVPHQVGTKGIKVHARAAGVDMSRVPNIVTRMGNIISAAIPVALRQLQGQGHLAAGNKLYLSGTGSGICIAQAGVIWDAA